MELTEAFALQSVRMLPNHRPAHRDMPGADTDHRIHMLRLAIADAEGLTLDTRESDRDTPSYTLHTLQELQAELPGAQLVFFLGTDAFAAFDTWYRWESILELAHLVVVDRPGRGLSSWAAELIQRQQGRLGTRLDDANAGIIIRQNVTQLAISATDIRRRVAAGRSLRYLLPESVRQYIEQQQLYR